jgi:hypothetical protein
MFRWLYILPYLIHEAGPARRDVRIRFLNARVETHAMKSSSFEYLDTTA